MRSQLQRGRVRHRRGTHGEWEKGRCVDVCTLHSALCNCLPHLASFSTPEQSPIEMKLSVCLIIAGTRGCSLRIDTLEYSASNSCGKGGDPNDCVCCKSTGGAPTCQTAAACDVAGSAPCCQLNPNTW